MYCPHCGKEVNESERYCSNCGAPLKGSAYEPKYTSTSNKEGKNGLIAFILSIASFAFGFICSIVALVLACRYPDEEYSKAAKIISIISIVYEVIVLVVGIILIVIFYREIMNYLNTFLENSQNLIRIF